LNFILIGMPGSGKTTLGMRFYDTDVSASDHIRSELRSKPQAEDHASSFFSTSCMNSLRLRNLWYRELPKKR
jgi:adenylate kinase family enzyme